MNYRAIKVSKPSINSFCFYSQQRIELIVKEM